MKCSNCKHSQSKRSLSCQQLFTNIRSGNNWWSVDQCFWLILLSLNVDTWLVIGYALRYRIKSHVAAVESRSILEFHKWQEMLLLDSRAGSWQRRMFIFDSGFRESPRVGICGYIVTQELHSQPSFVQNSTLRAMSKQYYRHRSLLDCGDWRCRKRYRTGTFVRWPCA